jgi:hypothetical protein
MNDALIALVDLGYANKAPAMSAQNVFYDLFQGQIAMNGYVTPMFWILKRVVRCPHCLCVHHLVWL